MKSNDREQAKTDFSSLNIHEKASKMDFGSANGRRDTPT
jgi:hypothetical protein